jgi:hypothetical protein
VSGEFGLGGLAVANPPGFARPDFFALRSARLELPLSRLLEQRVTIPVVELEGIALDLERNAKGTNYGPILAASRGRSPAPSAGQPFRRRRRKVFVAEAGHPTCARRSICPREATDGARLRGAGSWSRTSADDRAGAVCSWSGRDAGRAPGGPGRRPSRAPRGLARPQAGLKDVARVQFEGKLGEVEGQLNEQAKKLGPDAEKALDKASEELGKKLDGLLEKNDKKKKKN